MTIGTRRTSGLNLAARASRRLRRGRVARRAALWIWLLALAGFVAAGLVGWWQWQTLARLDTPIRWWGLLIGFLAAEWLVVHMRFGRRVHTFSMIAIPLVVGLLAVAPVELLAATSMGAVAYAGTRRREPIAMLILLVSRRLLEASVAVSVLALAEHSGDWFGPTGWLIVLAAAVAAHLVGHFLFSISSWVQGHESSAGDALEAYGFGAFVTILNGSLGMLIAEALFVAPQAAVFAVIPALALFIGYRAYASSRHERGRLKALYEATRDLHASPQLESSLVAAALHAREMFESEFCEIILELGADHAGFRTIVGPGDHQEAMDPVDLDKWRVVWDRAREGGEPYVIDRSGSLASSAGDRRLPISAAMVAPVPVGADVAGVIIVANPQNDSELFSKAELRLLAALAAQVGVAVENGRLEDSLAELTELKAELQHQAFHDGLTGLANRALFSESVFQALQLTRRTGGDVAVLFLDIDDFKHVNDRLGHVSGDEALRALGSRLQEQSAQEDTVARIGGDEFAILIQNVAGAQEASAAAKRIIDALAVPLRIAGREMPVTASIGIAFGRYGDTASQVLRDADAARYAAKRDGKNTFRLFEPDMHSEVVAQLKLKADLEAAIARQELRLLYQPIVDLENGSLRGFEALVRWQHALKGWQSPGTFIPFAEETGLIHDIGRWTLWEAARRCRDWVEKLQPEPGEFKVSVNLSARQLDEADIVDEVERVIEEMGFDPSFLVLEITETAIMSAAPELLDDLSALGVPLAIDDFGTGYSSLASLHKLSVDVLKIDQIFVKGIAEEDDSSPFVGTMVGLGQALGLQTIVEGIEHQAQLEKLRELGCRTGQGFYFAKPLAQSHANRLVDREVDGKPAFDLDAMAHGYRDRRLRSVP
ncbi:MAG: EAL domain-containing protein [Acidimicrobiia bacterium]|nr:EAL domain-containing protein [Acidimicrobiia bacterium]